MKNFFLTSFLLLIILKSFGQDGLGYFYDFNNHFYVFDKGNAIQLESNRVDSIKVGNDYLAYIDKQSNLKVYSNGETKVIEESVPRILVATANALVYKMEQRLMIYQNGKKTQLASWADRFFAGDSIVTWQASPSLDIMAYENAEIKTIEVAISTKVIKGGRAGKNIFAYSDLNNNFKIYYKGQVIETQAADIRNYKCGRDIVAYIDRFNSTFNVFDKGNIETISTRLPQNYSVSENMISYLDADNNFMVYFNGESIKIESFEPNFYQAKNNVIVYYNNPELKLFYEGKVYTLEKITEQKNIVIGVSSALYMDNAGRAKYFYKGKVVENFLIEKPLKIDLYRDLPVLTYGNNTVGFLYNGKLYEYETAQN